MLSHAQREVLPSPSRPGVAQRLYIAPSQTPPVGVLDCTRPDQLEDTIALGEADAGLYDHQLRLLLTRGAPTTTRSWTAA